MFRQILVPTTGDAFDAIVFETARAAALDSPAHLHMLFTRPDPADAAIAMSGGGMDGGAGLAALIQAVAEEGQVAQAAARAAWAKFSAVVSLQTGQTPGLLGLSTTLEVAAGRESALLVQQGRTSDLLVIGRPCGGQPADLDRLQAVLGGIGRPMLIAAPICPASLIQNIVIAWKDTAEAARAVSAAMPFIERAERVVVMTAGEAAADGDPAHHHARASAERLVATLQRHAPLVRTQHVSFGGGSPAQALLAAAAEAGASLLVMGGFGHGELRERIFGGFTRTVLGGAEMPVLMMR